MKRKDYVFPAPTKRNEKSHSGRDFLGQQAIIQNMTNRCLPSFTNTTRKLRYYTFWSWAAYIAADKLRGETDSNKIWKYLFKLENALIIANKYADPKISGLSGVRQIPYGLEKLANIKDSDEITLYSDYRRDRSSYMSDQYSPSLSYLNILHRENDAIYLSPSGLGQKLALVFDQNIKKCDGYKSLISTNEKSMRWAKFKSLIEPLSLKIFSKSERELLIKMLEQNEEDELLPNGISPRVNTILLVLDIISNNEIALNNDILTILYNDNYKAPDYLRNIQSGFKVVEIRRNYQLCIESIFSSFCYFLDLEGTFDEFIELNYLGLKDFEINSALPFVNVSPSDSLGSVFEKAIKIYSKQKYTEIEFQEIIFTYFKQYGESITSKTSLAALLFLCSINQKLNMCDLSSNQLFNKFVNYPSNTTHSLKYINTLINKSMDMPIIKAIKNIFIELSLKLHLEVSQEKVFSTGNFTFHFVRSDKGGFRGLRNLGNPGMTSNKLVNFLDIIYDSGLIDYDNDSYCITKSGQAFINKYTK